MSVKVFIAVFVLLLSFNLHDYSHKRELQTVLCETVATTIALPELQYQPCVI